MMNSMDKMEDYDRLARVAETLAKKNEELEAANAAFHVDLRDVVSLSAQLLEANKQIAYLEGLVALQADALEEQVQYILDANDTCAFPKVVISGQKAISATAETVQAFRDKLTEPLRMEVAMLREFIEDHESADNSGCEYPSECIACGERYGKHTKDCELVSVLNHTQATAQAYEQEVEARGAVKALEKAAKRFVEAYGADYDMSMVSVADELECIIAELRATSKKAG